MSIPWLHMFHALRRHRLTSVVIVLELAISCAVLSNSFSVFINSVAALRINSGIQEGSVVYVHVIGDSRRVGGEEVEGRELLRVLASIPGVLGAGTVSALPFAGTPMSDSVALTSAGPTVNVGEYLIGGHAMDALGLILTRGRRFKPDDVSLLAKDGVLQPGVVIVTEALAKHLFGSKNALDQQIYVSGVPMTIIGIVRRLVQPLPRIDPTAAYSIILPVDIFSAPELVPPFLVMGCKPNACADVLLRARHAVAASPLDLSILDQGNLGDTRSSFFSRERETLWLVGVSAFALLFVTAAGFFGLGSYWVLQRHRQIGIRRALGGRRAEIRAYFHAENLVVSVVGIIVGLVGATLLNVTLMRFFELHRLSLSFAPFAALVIVAVGQLGNV